MPNKKGKELLRLREEMEVVIPNSMHIKEFNELSDEHLQQLAMNYQNINAVHYVKLCMDILNKRKN